MEQSKEAFQAPSLGQESGVGSCCVELQRLGVMEEENQTVESERGNYGGRIRRKKLAAKSGRRGRWRRLRADGRRREAVQRNAGGAVRVQISE